jgi:hypothetical protein
LEIRNVDTDLTENTGTNMHGRHNMRVVAYDIIDKGIQVVLIIVVIVRYAQGLAIPVHAIKLGHVDRQFREVENGAETAAYAANRGIEPEKDLWRETEFEKQVRYPFL